METIQGYLFSSPEAFLHLLCDRGVAWMEEALLLRKRLSLEVKTEQLKHSPCCIEMMNRAAAGECQQNTQAQVFWGKEIIISM